ncbi:MAG: hypothetical protein WCJ30_09900, partial [Deltaproteobacteria bacterium]
GREAVAIESTLTVLDRLLLDVLDVASRGEARPAVRAGIDPDERRWILRAAPHAAALLEGT